ncbi:MAG: isopropylmalate isomerase [Erythrobacter sp.]|nr:isopropylmalate isomerase [Erythrobacter sp.]
MTDKKMTSGNKAAIGAAAIGSAAVAAALLYAGRKFGAKKKPNEPTQPGPIPSGEPPQTD